MNRGLWVDAGNDLDYTKAWKNSITEPVYDARDPRLTDAYMDGVRSRGFTPAIYVCSQGEGWPNASSTTPQAFAKYASDFLLKYTPNSSTSVRMHLNCETHNVAWIMDMLKAYRVLRPTRITLWTMEGHQAGLFAGYGAQIAAANVQVAPQCYLGNMDRIESAAEVAAWAQIGIPLGRIRPVLDAAHLGAWWDGVAYTQGRLP